MLALLLITLLDGSTIHLQAPETTQFDVQTPYGALKIPLKDVRILELGAHVDDEKPYQEAAHNLGNVNYKFRDKATVFLRANERGAYKYLLPLKDSEDTEVKRRVEVLLGEFRGIYPPLNDVITTPTGITCGFIQQAEIKGKSDALGEIAIKLTHIKSVAFKTRTSTAKITHSQGWQEFGYVAGKVRITATGQVDLWPQSPGQYIAGPNGMQNGSLMPNGYNSGALIGRVNGGASFLVGDFIDANLGVGKLELKMNDSAWPNCFPEGSYEVVVQ